MWTGKIGDFFRKELMKRVKKFIIGVRGEIAGKRGSWVPLVKYLLS